MRALLLSFFFMLLSLSFNAGIGVSFPGVKVRHLSRRGCM